MRRLKRAHINSGLNYEVIYAPVFCCTCSTNKNEEENKMLKIEIAEGTDRFKFPCLIEHIDEAGTTIFIAVKTGPDGDVLYGIVLQTTSKDFERHIFDFGGFAKDECSLFNGKIVLENT